MQNSVICLESINKRAKHTLHNTKPVAIGTAWHLKKKKHFAWISVSLMH